MAKIGTNTCYTTWWPNLKPSDATFTLISVRKIILFIESISWVRCASGNVWKWHLSCNYVKLVCHFVTNCRKTFKYGISCHKKMDSALWAEENGMHCIPSRLLILFCSVQDDLDFLMIILSHCTSCPVELGNNLLVATMCAYVRVWIHNLHQRKLRQTKKGWPTGI